MASEPVLIVQVALDGAVDRRLRAEPPQAVASGDAVVTRGPRDENGNLLPPAAGDVVLSVPSPEALARDADEVRRGLTMAGTGTEPLVVVVEAAEELRDDELTAVVDAARRAPRPVVLRVLRDG